MPGQDGKLARTDAPAADMCDELTRAVGTRVRHARTAHGLSRRALSERSGVSQRYLAQVESGEGNISIALLARLGRALDWPIAGFLDAAPTDPDFQRMAALWQGADADRRRAALDVLAPRPDRNRRVALIGLRGAGKSTMGRRTAAALDAPFAELNDVIEKESGLPVADVIALYGQDGYRALERRALQKSLAEHDRMILAVAGGIVGDEGTFSLLLEQCFTIWLKAAPDEHMQRVRAQGDERPMAGSSDAMGALKAILGAREAQYARSDVTLETSGRTEDETLADLLDLIERNALLA